MNIGGNYKTTKNDLLYPDISYRINGILIDVSKSLGGGHREKFYQKAVAEGLSGIKIDFKEQVYVPLKYNNKIVGKYFLDFLIEEKIILELKSGSFVNYSIIKQTKEYLVALDLKLAIIGCFTYKGVVIKRILNIY